MPSTLVSCIVPVFDGERYLRETLDSIFAQSHRPIEVIVADDGSTDGTVEVVRGDDRPIVYTHQPNAGPAAARNLGLRAARGDLVAFLDADDLWHPEKLALQTAHLGARPELDLCFTHLRNFWTPELAPPALGAEDDPTARALPGLCTDTLLARRSVFDRTGAFDETLRHGDDTDWFLRAAEGGALVEVLPQVLVRRRLHGTNRSVRRADASREEYLRIVKASLERRRRPDGGVERAYGFPRSSGARSG